MKHLFWLTQLGFFKLLHCVLWYPVSIPVRLLYFPFLLRLLGTSPCLPRLKITEDLFQEQKLTALLHPHLHYICCGPQVWALGWDGLKWGIFFWRNSSCMTTAAEVELLLWGNLISLPRLLAPFPNRLCCFCCFCYSALMRLSSSPLKTSAFCRVKADSNKLGHLL